MGSVLTVSQFTPSKQVIAEPVGTLSFGGVVVMPTDSVYGIGCAATANNPAHERIFAIKRRDRAQTLPWLIANVDDLQTYGRNVPTWMHALARELWPGALTLVLDVEGGGTEGLRVPDHAVARSLCEAAGGLLRCTSANRSGEPPALDAASAAAAIPEADLLVDAGPSPGGVASTVVRLSPSGALEILRAGAISPTTIESVLTSLPA